MENVLMRRFFAGFIVFFLVLMPVTALARGLDTVVLDPGHGGYDFGVNSGDSREKEITLSIAKKLKSFLREEGRKVFLTREVDRYLSLADRRDRIAASSADLFMSLHLSDSESAMIYVTWYKETEADLSLGEYYDIDSRQRRYLYESRVFAGIVGEALGTEFGVTVYYGELPLPVLSATGAPAVLVELPSRGVDYNAETMLRFAYALGIGMQAYGQQ